ncbi:MrcB family domain-containing protein [Chromatocurvus halotolerans]|uniref:Uncharacterized protein DUF3883 n=1 Tax=Chromatocurvus halotolerans TaxID=1132028 RepID=A0A4R2KRV4_9GAMM|nr:DUF3578 domain-containing protein [Chromatocurvus halotolerans]TCO73709.1 uncharacterized protein DUF3883 [Chromatocurvus halotolerans]
MKSEIARIANLQREYTSENTPAMKQRGELIRQTLPNLFRSAWPALTARMGQFAATLAVHGKDGIGRKTEAPWVRFHCRERSPNATDGYYVVIHFSRDGRRVYVTLGCSSSTWDAERGDLRTTSGEELDARILWMLQELEEAGADVSGFPDQIELGATAALPKSFERATALARAFDPENLDEQAFLDAIAEALGLLAIIYASVDRGRNLNAREIDLSAIEAITNPTRQTAANRQGFALTGDERRAVELCAMAVAKRQLELEGYAVEDTSASKPYDFLAERDGVAIKVEVKGTTSALLDAVLMTANEVALHTEQAGKTALALVSNIELDKSVSPPAAAGGKLELFNPWDIADWDSRAVTFQVSRSRQR